MRRYFWPAAAGCLAAFALWLVCRKRGSALGRDALAWRRWNLLAFGWPPLCLALVAAILSRPGRTGEQKIADTMFCLIPLVFFAAGMSIERRLLKERRRASAPAMALVVSAGKRVRPGKTSYFPEYQFQAEGKTYHVTSRAGYGFCPVKEGEEVPIFYAPEDPSFFYAPALQKRDRRVAGLLRTLGLVLPLLGFFAPRLRALAALLAAL